MGFKRLEDIVAFQFAEEFKSGVYALIHASPEASRRLRFRDQVEDAADGIGACIAEGFRRNNPGEFAQCIRYALGSLGECKKRLRDGIDRGYWKEADCQSTLRWAERCNCVSLKLYQSQRRLAEENQIAKRSPRPKCNRRRRE